jgi:hypothetical protein
MIKTIVSDNAGDFDYAINDFGKYHSVSDIKTFISAKDKTFIAVLTYVNMKGDFD